MAIAKGQLKNKNANVREFIAEVKADPEVSVVALEKSKNRSFLGGLYCNTDLTKAEIMYLFNLNETTLKAWMRDGDWRKERRIQKLNKKALTNYIYSGWYHVIKVQSEGEDQIRKKFNDYFYKFQVMVEDCISQPHIDGNRLTTIAKASKVTMDNMLGQFEANNILSTKETKEVEIKMKQIDLKAKQVENDKNKGKVVVETVQGYDSESAMSKGEVAFLVQNILKEVPNVSKEDMERIIEDIKNNL